MKKYADNKLNPETYKEKNSEKKKSLLIRKKKNKK